MMRGKGLDQDGFIEREGGLERVPEAFAPVVAAAKTAILAAFGCGRLHSAYLYGSVPRGTAVPGRSDLDVLLALTAEPADADRAAASRVEGDLGARFPQISGAGILLYSTATLLSDLERYDLGWFVACLCTPLAGKDLAARLPRYRPTSLLARETNGDLGDLLPRWRGRLGYPARAEQMKIAAAAGRAPTEDRAVLGMLIGDLGPWLAAEYVSEHGRKTPRAGYQDQT
jgi:uncharacterized protein